MAACSSLASVGKVMAFGCTVVSTVTRLRSWLRTAPASYATRRLSANNNSSLSPSRLRQWLKSERSCGKVCWKNSSPVKNWKYGSWTQRSHFIGQPVNVLEQQQPDHEAGLDPWPAVLAVKRRDLAVDPVPIDLAGKQNQLVLQVNDLVQPRPKKIVRSRRLVLLRSHRPVRCTTESWSAGKGNPQIKLQGLGVSSSQSLQSQMLPQQKNRLPINRLEACS